MQDNTQRPGEGVHSYNIRMATRLDRMGFDVSIKDDRTDPIQISDKSDLKVMTGYGYGHSIEGAYEMLRRKIESRMSELRIMQVRLDTAMKGNWKNEPEYVFIRKEDTPSKET